MNIGVSRIELRLPEIQSLKDKRRILKSLIARLQNEFHVSVAEIDNRDRWQLSTIGVACVSNNSQHANEVLSHAVNFVTGNYPQLELLDYQIEIVPVL
jgi:uncharacterized protein YlxP (DUF503 family)